MIWTLLAWLGFLGLLGFGWVAVASLRGAMQCRASMLWLLGAWTGLSALGGLLVWRAALLETWSFSLWIGLALAAIAPIAWTLGNVGKRLQAHGIKLGNLLKFR